MTSPPYDAADREPVPALGLVLEEDRGSLPFALIHGEALVACAAWALGEAGAELVDVGTPWSELVEREMPVVLHDALCPMTPADFVAACVATAAARSAVVVGVRPVTDTVKATRRVDGAELLGETLDRDELLAVASPVVLPAATVAALDGLPTTDLPDLVATLARRLPVVPLLAPPAARRVDSAAELLLLEALTSPGEAPAGRAAGAPPS